VRLGGHSPRRKTVGGRHASRAYGPHRPVPGAGMPGADSHQNPRRARNHQGVLRVEAADFGLRAYLTVHVNPEDVVHEMRGICSFEGFRTRSPDLAEVFRSLTAEVARHEPDTRIPGERGARAGPPQT